MLEYSRWIIVPSLIPGRLHCSGHELPEEKLAAWRRDVFLGMAIYDTAAHLLLVPDAATPLIMLYASGNLLARGNLLNAS